MAFFHAQTPIIQPPHHDHSYSESGTTVNEELDMETAELIANLALDDLAEHMSTRGTRNSLPSNDEIAYLLQCDQLNGFLSTVADAKDAKSVNPFITAEEAAVVDWIAAERLSRGEALPAPKSRQTRLEDPNFIMDPELITDFTVYVWMIFYRRFVIFIDC